jgi:hypothetical protein
MLGLSPKTKTKASTLLETVIAFFIIAGGMAIVAALYASTLGTQGRDVEASVMVTLAKSRIAQLRSLASDYNAYQGLSGQTGTISPADYPEFEVRTAVSSATVPYPCPGLTTLDFTSSYQNVTVRVLGPSGRDLLMSTMIGIPPTEAETLRVVQTAGSTPLPRDDQADFEASLVAVDGTTIPDLQFTFYIDYGTGYGQLVEDPNGRVVHFFNRIVNVTGTNIYTGGEVRIVARTFYAGREYRGVSAPLVLVN